MLEKLGVFDTQAQRVEASYTTVVRRYVEAGFGIGIVPGLPGARRTSSLHERPMGKHFGRVMINLIWRKGAVQPEHVQAFAEVVRELRKA
jgi:DNA-binding transcriptional LysR family regulator